MYFTFQKSTKGADNNIQIVYTLLEKGADLYIKNKKDETPVDLIHDPTMKTMIEKYEVLFYYVSPHTFFDRETCGCWAFGLDGWISGIPTWLFLSGLFVELRWNFLSSKPVCIVGNFLEFNILIRIQLYKKVT